MAAAYRIEFKPSVLKDIRRFPQMVLQRIYQRFDELAHDPFPPGAKKMEGYHDHYRIRLGNYRIVYRVEQTVLVITVIKIGDRKNVYRGL